MTKLYLLLLAFGSGLLLQAQNFTGRAYYKTATSMDISLDSSTVSADQQKMIMDMLQKSMQKEYVLSFDRNTSLYKEVEKLDQGGINVGGIIASFTGGGGLTYKNLSEEHYLEQKELFGKLFLIDDTLEKLDWKLEKEKKQIGSYMCFKATATRKTVRKSFQSEEDEDGDFEQTDSVETQITAWYTPQIPISNGPAEYGGLPGLILELAHGKTIVACYKVQLNPKEAVLIEAPEDGQKVTQKEYFEIVDKKVQEMQKMYGDHRKSEGQEGMRIEITR